MKILSSIFATIFNEKPHNDDTSVLQAFSSSDGPRPLPDGFKFNMWVSAKTTVIPKWKPFPVWQRHHRIYNKVDIASQSFQAISK